MHDIALIRTTDNEWADGILYGVVGVFDMTYGVAVSI